MSDVFLSYAREDRLIIERLASALEAEGIALWWDRQLAGGVEFTKETEVKLNGAKAIVVAWSKASVDSIWVGDEAAIGREKGNLIPIAIEAVVPKLGFRGIHTIELAGWKGDRNAPEFLDLVRTLKARTTGEVPEIVPVRRRPSPFRPSLLAAIGTGAALLIGVLLFIFKPVEPTAVPHPEATAPPTADVITNVAPEVSAASIAVLPFADMSENKDQGYFADGMAEEILNVLARVEGLKVASRTSSFAFKTQPDASAPAIAAELGVRHILEGSVRKAGETVRITVQLVDTDNEQHLWSETFDRPLTTKNLFAIQDEVAGAVVTTLREKIGAQVGETTPAPTRTDDVDAYGLFLKARVLFQARRDLNMADSLLAEALTLDPRFTDALAIRAAIREVGGNFGAKFGDSVEARAHGRTFVKEALAYDPDNSLALAVNALYDHRDNVIGKGARPYPAIFSAFDRALEVDPTNSNALHWKALILNYTGDTAGAIPIHQRCIEIDPALAICRTALAAELLSLGRRQEAEAIMDAAAKYGALTSNMQVMFILAELKWREAFRFLAPNVLALRGWRDFDALYEVLSESRGDNRATASRLKALLVENDATQESDLLLNALGDFERPVLSPGGLWMKSLRNYRRSPQFKQHMRAAGLVDYWRTHGFPPQCRPVGTDDFECD